MANPITECDRVRSYAAPDPPICMPAESAASVGGAAPKDRYERELVLTRSSVRCQARTADLLPPRTRMTGGSAGARFVLRSASHQSPAPFHPGQVPVACLLAGGQQAGKGSRQRRCGARPCLVKEVTCRGDLCSPTVSRSGPRSPLFNVWAVRLLSLSGVTPGYWPGSASGPASCFASQISSCLRGVREAAQGRRSRVRGPKVGCRRRRYATSPRHDRGGQCCRGRHAAVTAVAARPGRSRCA